ncbi:LysM peptidoglycan-binding domain-containing protein [Paraburkholderia sp. 31.1]|uniref:LysM peptidoglycan-binding domain-containing protein n=1 Tax=Paraburkholderia sp. 31.1 TaxID=2615205 RepID=UPI001655DD29|nr:LysM peptidoglycan-binding domain-containing protein [Paraburkholderia sp. 31.1]MBC8724628.1 LysM peptidoglycan-binding domain-containing protein [Paraburkholderia sp. 31.1]
MVIQLVERDVSVDAKAAALSDQEGTSGQHVEYSYYSHGLVRSIMDYGTQTQSLYEYDGDGNRTAEFFTDFGNSYVFAQSRVEYDALNRVVAIRDNSYQVGYEYDAVGNRRRMMATYTDMVGYHATEQEYWYEYDALNRFTVSMGSLSGTRATDPDDTSVHIVAGAAGGDGVQLGYNAAGERTMAVYAKDGRTEYYTYDANGLLATQTVDGMMIQQRTNDLLGRVTETIERDRSSGQIVTAVTRDWDADSQLMSEHDNIEGTTTTYTRMADGTLGQVATRPDNGSGTTLTSTYSYEWWDSAKQSQILAQGSNPDAPGWRPASSYFNYDVNGNLKATYDDGGGQAGSARAFTYYTDLRGQVQRRDELVGVTVADDGTIRGATGDRKHNYYYLNGNRVGNQGNDGVETVDYVQELAGRLAKGSESQYKVFTPVGSADFDENFMAINGVYPGVSPGTWTVRDGDTLQSIASSLWGDATLWYILADANGLKGDDVLKAGQMLTVPNQVTNVHNTATTFKPYDPGKAIGNTQPTLPDPPPPPSKDGGCGGVAQIFAVVIAVAVSVVSMGTGSIVGAMLIGAAGAAATQGVMIAAGEQHGFDWKGMAIGAVSAGIGAAAAPATSFWTAAAQGAVRSAATQGMALAVGAQRGFDWKGMAASAVASGVGFQAARTINVGGSNLGFNMGSDPGRFVTGMGAGIAAGAASTIVRGGSLGRNVGAISMDAIASTIGNLVVDRVAATDTTKLRTQQAIDAMNGQILPGGIGGVGSGFVEAPYSSNSALFGVYGGLVDSSQTPYAGAAALFGPSSGLATSQIDPRPAVLADNSGGSDNLLYAWDRAKQYGADGWNATKQFAHDMVGATSMDAARANWDAGNYGTAVTKGARSFLEAGMSVFTLGTAVPIKTGITALVNGGRAALASEMLAGGAPIFSSGGLLGSRMWASSVGTGAISAGVNAGAQYFLTGDVNPVDVGVSLAAGALGTRSGLRWNMAVNAVGGATGTAVNNVVYGKDDSIGGAAFTSGVLSSFGYGLGKLGQGAITSSFRPSLTSSDWAATGVWSSAGWNLLNPNHLPVVAGSLGGGRPVRKLSMPSICRCNRSSEARNDEKVTFRIREVAPDLRARNGCDWRRWGVLELLLRGWLLPDVGNRRGARSGEY